MIVSTEIRASIDSYLDFWRMAGVDCAFDESSTNWFEHSKQASNVAPVSPKDAPARPAAYDKPVPNQIESNFVAQDEWPHSFEALQQQIAAGVAFPGNTYSRKIALPFGTVQPELMVLGDVPEIEDIELGRLDRGHFGRMAVAMANAVGINADRIYYSALATTRPGTGALPEDHKEELHAFFRHNIGIIQPKMILVFGPNAAQILLATDFMEARGSLLNINHKGGNVAAVTTFHPRTLLTNPTLKAVAWQDLQMLAKRVHSED